MRGALTLSLAALLPLMACGGGAEIDPAVPDLPEDPDADQHGDPDVGDIAITSPEDNVLTSSMTIEVSGVVRGDFQEVDVNGATVAVEPDGSFATEVELVEGNNEIHAKAGAGDAWVIVRCDVTAPEVQVAAPGRGAFVDALSMPQVELSGTIADAHGLTSVTVNGTPATVDAGGAFRFLDESRAYGVHYYAVEATDNAGNVGATGLSILYGEFAPASTPVSDAVVALAAPEALDAVETGAQEMLQQLDLEAIALAANPVGELLGQSLYADSLTYGGLSLEVLPTDQGLQVTVTLQNLEMGYHVDILGPWDLYGSAWADEAVLSGVVDAWATESGTIDAALIESSVDFAGFGFDVVPSGVEDALFSDMVSNKLREDIQSAVADRVPARIAEQLARLDLSRDLEFHGIALSLDLQPTVLEIDRGGVTLRADAAVWGQDAGVTPVSPGTLRTPSDAPELAGDALAVSFADDTINQVLSVAWKAGLLDREIPLSGPNGPVTLGTVSQLFRALAGLAPADTQVIATLNPLLPPVAQLDENGGSISIGEFQVLLEADVPGERVSLVKLAVYVVANLQVEFGEEGLVSLSIRDYTVTADPVEAPAGFPEGQEFHALLAAIMELMAPEIEAPLASLPIPSFGGFSLSGLEMNEDGPRGDYLTLTCDVGRL